MDIPDQFEEIRIFFADDRLVAVLEQMTPSLVPQVEADGIARQETPHERGQSCLTTAHEQMEMVGHECPGINAGIRFFYNLPQTVEEVPAIRVAPEDGGSIDASHHDVLQSSFEIEPWSPRHVIPLID
jgi:hypothetical protein